jgi:hypothetical protein
MALLDGSPDGGVKGAAGERGRGRANSVAASGGRARGSRPLLAGCAAGGRGAGLVVCGCRQIAAPYLVGPMSATAKQDRGGGVRKAAAGLGNPGIHHYDTAIPATRQEKAEGRRGGGGEREAGGGGRRGWCFGRWAGCWGGRGIAGWGCPGKCCCGVLSLDASSLAGRVGPSFRWDGSATPVQFTFRLI